MPLRSKKPWEKASPIRKNSGTYDDFFQMPFKTPPPPNCFPIFNIFPRPSQTPSQTFLQYLNFSSFILDTHPYFRTCSPLVVFTGNGKNYPPFRITECHRRKKNFHAEFFQNSRLRIPTHPSWNPPPPHLTPHLLLSKIYPLQSCLL